MIKIQKLKRANKRSGFELAPGCNTKVKGILISNENSFTIYVDKFSCKRKKKFKK